MPFEILPWGPLKRRKGYRDSGQSLKDIKDCGFTRSCFLEPKDIPLCREAGLEPITFIFDTPENFVKPRSDEFELSSDGRSNIMRLAADKSADEETIDRVMKSALDELPEDYDGKVFIVDEPGASQFERIKFMCDAVKKYRPDSIPYVNLFPNYAVCGAPNLSQLETPTYEDYLDSFCKALPGIPVSLDNYRVFVSLDFKDAAHEKAFYMNYVQAREACDKYGVEFHHIICSNQLRGFQAIPTFENMLFEANTSLAAGARLISWYTYFGRGGYLWAPVDDNTDEDIRTSVWYLVREINRRILSMGNLLYDMQYDGFYLKDIPGVPRSKDIGECGCVTKFTSDERCMTGHYIDGDTDVIIVVNGSLEKSTRIEVELNGKAPLIWSIEEGKFRESINTGRSPMWLAPGDAVIYRSR